MTDGEPIPDHQDNPMNDFESTLYLPACLTMYWYCQSIGLSSKIQTWFTFNKTEIQTVILPGSNLIPSSSKTER